MERSMTAFTTQAKTRLTLGLTVLTLGGMALIAPAPARAADFGFDEEIGLRAPVERRVVVEERRVEERRVIRPAYGYGARFLGPPVYARPVGFGYARPAFWGQGGYARPVYGEECRVVVKKRVDPWGGVVVKRISTCD
jgi:hypothetical protein